MTYHRFYCPTHLDSQTLSMAYRCQTLPGHITSHFYQSARSKLRTFCVSSKQDLCTFPLQLCRMQNIVREYCKIFAAEARVIENFGPALE